MNIASFLKISTALPVAAMLALAGCGGGGGTALNMMKDDGPPMMPAPLTLANGLSIGDVEPLLADGTIADREIALADGTKTFRAYSASIIRDWSDDDDPNTLPEFSIPDGEEQIKSIRGDGDYGFHVTYADAEGSETTVHLSKDDFNEEGNNYNNMGYWIWAQSATSFNGENWGGGSTTGFYAFIGATAPRTGPGHTQFMALYGLETPDSFIDTLEAGATAEYQGLMYAEAYTRGVTGRDSGRTYLRSNDLTLNYEYTGQGAGTVTGMITGMSAQRPGQSVEDAEDIDGTISLAGKAQGAQFSAIMTGTGSEMGGYTGGAVGTAFGPEAEAVGAVFSMERDGDHPHHVLRGLIGSLQQTPQ